MQLNTDAGKLNVVVEGALEKAGQALLKMRDAIADTPIAQKTGRLLLLPLPLPLWFVGPSSVGNTARAHSARYGC